MSESVLQIAVVLLLVLCCVMSSSAEQQAPQYFQERGDTIFIGQDWYLKNPHPVEKVDRDSLPFVETDSSADSGLVWGSKATITNALDTYNPETEMVGNHIFASWFGGLVIAEEVFCSSSPDFGLDWGDSTVLSIVDTRASKYSRIDGNDSLIFVIWKDGGDNPTLLRKVEIHSGTWSDIITVAEYHGGGDPFTYRPDITNNDSLLLVTYEGSDASGWNQRFKKSTDWGDTWINERVVGGVASGKGAEIAHGDGVIHVVRGSGGFTDVRYDRSTDFGETWSDDSFISELDAFYSQWPSVAADPYGNVYAAWFDYKDSPYPERGYLFFRRSTDRGETWEEIKYLSTEPEATRSDIYADSDGVYVIWTHGIPGQWMDTRLRMSTDFGETWSPERDLNDSLATTWHPQIDGDGNYLSVVYDCNDYGRSIRSITHRLGGWLLVGDADGNRIIEISDAVHLINYIFVPGSLPPVLPGSGDADCNDITEITDAVYLINFIFVPGSAPPGDPNNDGEPDC